MGLDRKAFRIKPFVKPKQNERMIPQAVGCRVGNCAPGLCLQGSCGLDCGLILGCTV